MKILLKWLVYSIVILAAAYNLPGVMVDDFGTALIAALVLGLINLIIKPLIVVLTLPINILTLGLFTLVINALLVMLAGAIVPGFQISGFGAALIFSVILSIVVFIFNKLIKS